MLPRVNSENHPAVTDVELLGFADLSLTDNEFSLPDNKMKQKPSKTPTRSRRSPRKTLSEIQPSVATSMEVTESVESYFMQQDGKFGLGKTSNRTLSALCAHDGSHIIDPLTFEQLLKDHKSSSWGISEMLQQKIGRRLFAKWPFYLYEGFNILAYGVGSKQPILENFRKLHLKKYSCIVVPAYEPSISIKQILHAICNDWLQLSAHPKKPTAQLQLITQFMHQNAATGSPLYLLIHNIDGPGLRNAKAQAILAHLASIPNIHLIASIDHVNMPILWSHNELARFSWIWEDCSSLADHVTETCYANSPLLQTILTGLSASDGLGTGFSGGTMLASLRQVAASLTQNAREIFRMIAEHQLNAPLHETLGNNVGMPLEDLYWRCRDAFLTNSEATLRAQLTEFRDHKLLKIRKCADGTEMLVIPMDNASLHKFVKNFDSFC